MAAFAKKQTLGHMKNMTKPVISSDVMGNRNVEVKAVGAWVQPAVHGPSNEVPEAILAAVEEEMKIRQMKREKEERIRKFQEDVKKRVRKLNKLKRLNEMQQNFQAIEQQREIIRQSAESADRLSPRKNHCLLRKDQEPSIKAKPEPVIRGGWVNSDEPNLAFHDKSNQVHRITSQARQKLVSHRITTDEFASDDLPGGMWKASETRNVNTNANVMSSIDINNQADDEEDADQFNEVDEEDEKENNKKEVRFDLAAEVACDKNSNRIRSAGYRNLSTSTHIPDIYIGVQQEVEKRRLQNQQALYRRLFMDIEREQVKENLRRQEHRKRIQRLKKEKEEERRLEEDNSFKLVQPRDPITGETTEEVLLREQMEQMKIKESLMKLNEEKKKAREMKRYVDALRHRLQEKVRNRGIQIPPLCCCGDSVWDTNPDTCANNCYFYRNPRAYAKALQSLLVSCEVV